MKEFLKLSNQKKLRLDQMLVERGLMASRSRAAAAVITGQVRVNGEPVTKPGTRFDKNCQIDIKVKEKTYASRGGIKLAAALDEFTIDPSGLVVLDGGASTGGFTDCLLKRGARKVIAVDVGYGQLDWRLRQDKRVEVMERVNLRYLKPANISEPAALATVDVSFISLTKVIEALRGCLIEDGTMLLLVKPQFEVGRGQVGKGGIVKDQAKHRQALLNVAEQLSDYGLSLQGLTNSPIVGAKGNIEFWLYVAKTKPAAINSDRLSGIVAAVVARAHKKLALI